MQPSCGRDHGGARRGQLGQGRLTVARSQLHRPGAGGRHRHPVAEAEGVESGGLHAHVEGQADHHHLGDAPLPEQAVELGGDISAGTGSRMVNPE